MEAVDRALAALLRRDVLGDAVEVSLEAPNRPWSQGVTKPTINLFLFDVRENLVRREVMVEPVRDASGAVVGRRPPPTRYDLFYILSCWGTPVELEHQILSAVIASLGTYDKLPDDLFGPDAPPHGCFLSTVAGMKRGMLPMFGGELRMQLDLAVTVPLVAPSVAVAGPPVREPARIQVNGRSPEEIADVRRRTTRLPAPRVPHADPFAPTRAAIAAAVEAMPPPKPPPPAGPPGKQPPGAPGQRPPGAPGQRPPGAPPAGQQRPPGAPPAGQRPAGQPPAGAPPAGAPPAGSAAGCRRSPRLRRRNPLQLLRVALAQAAQAQSALAQAVAGLSTLLPAPAPAPAQLLPHQHLLPQPRPTAPHAACCARARTDRAERHPPSRPRARRPTDCTKGQARRVSPGPATALSRRVAHQAGPPAGR